MRGYPRTFTKLDCFDGYRVASSSTTMVRVRRWNGAPNQCHGLLTDLLWRNGEQNGYPKCRPTGT